MANRPATARSLLEAIRPTEADGPLRAAVLSTYGLALDQPNFFEHDFLPALLGIGSVRDRGFAAPVTLERKLGDVYCALVCDAHALAEGARPSLRIDVVPIARPRHHAKVVLIHRRRLVRVVVSSANLTHAGYRSQREAAAVLDFREDGGLDPSILKGLVSGWLESLGGAATKPLRAALEGAVAATEKWPARDTRGPAPHIQVAFGGGPTPLWQQLVDAWPRGEPVLTWQVCSPFWPGADSGVTPFEAIAGGLGLRDVALGDTRLELICQADVVGDRAHPVFPFGVVSGLRARHFPVAKGRLVPARLEALDDEVPDRKAGGNRPLHAKWVVLRGPRTAVALLGSANFTNTGLGVVKGANIEAGVLIRGPVELFGENDWRPPLAEDGAVDWATCAGHSLTPPPAEPDEPVVWPTHLVRVDLDIHWADGPDPGGTLVLSFATDGFSPTVVLMPGEAAVAPTELARVESVPATADRSCPLTVDSATVRRLLVNRTVKVRWDEPPKVAAYPINILDRAKAGLPSALGARPDEQQLLAYFHGRIGEDDLLALLEERARRAAENTGAGTDAAPSVELQNYLIREFVESLYGLEATLTAAAYSPRALEAALLGEFSPAALAGRILDALCERRRSPTGAAFQFTELVRVVAGLPLDKGEADRKALADVRDRAVERLLELVARAAATPAVAAALQDNHFADYVRASLPRELALRFLATAGKSTAPAENLTEEHP
jgi:hypothetical protein